MAELHRVRIRENSYLKLNDDDLKAWKAAGNVEYGDASKPEEADTSLDDARKANDDDAIAAKVVGAPKPAAKKNAV